MQPGGGITVDYAVQAFLESKGPKDENVEEATRKKLEVLFRQRLLPYAALCGFRVISQFDDLDVATKFRELGQSQSSTQPEGEPTATAATALFQYCPN